MAADRSERENDDKRAHAAASAASLDPPAGSPRGGVALLLNHAVEFRKPLSLRLLDGQASREHIVNCGGARPETVMGPCGSLVNAFEKARDKEIGLTRLCVSL